MVTLITPATKQVVCCRYCGQSQKLVRHGRTSSGNPRYRCLACNKTFCQNPGTAAHPAALKEQVLAAYQERCSMRGIARIFGISRNTLARWVKKSV
jgi:transposase-like protein